MVLVLVLLPALAPVAGAAAEAGEGAESSAGEIATALVAYPRQGRRRSSRVMLVVGRAGHPVDARTMSPGPARGSCSRLAVLAIALGVAFGAANLFGVSLRAGRLLCR